MYKNNSRDSSKFKDFSPLKLRSGLTGKCHAICHYSYNLPLQAILNEMNQRFNKWEILVDNNY